MATMSTTEPVFPAHDDFSPTDTNSTTGVTVDSPELGKTEDLNQESQNLEVQAPTIDNDIQPGESSSPSLKPANSYSASDFSSPASSTPDDDVLGGLHARQDSGVGLDEKFTAATVTGEATLEEVERPISSTNSTQKRAATDVSALIIDLGDVCCNWTAPQSLPISPAMLHRLLKTHTWYDYDSGTLTQEDCYTNLATQYGVSSADVGEAFKQAASSLSPNEETFEILRQLKATYQNSPKIYLMSNIPLPEWEAVRADDRYDWTMFDGFFPSGQVGMCKPELRFFWHVLDAIKLRPKDVVFIDDNAENILAARSLGVRCLRYKNAIGLRRFIHSVFDDPIERGRGWLRKNAKKMWSETTEGREVRDNFAQLFLYEACGDM